jgi:SAM-dependent methyltransferase
MSRANDIYLKIYYFICGKHPNIRPWHAQWLAVKDLYKDLKRILPSLKGNVLDVGCGSKPYKMWMKQSNSYVGLDNFPGPDVDIVVKEEEPWPIADACFDTVLCTQVLEHVSDLRRILDEIHRILKPGGNLVITVPFIYNVHVVDNASGQSSDYRRFTMYEIRNLFSDRYDIVELKSQGGIGSTLGILVLNWIEISSSSYKLTSFLKAIFFPFWLLFSMLMNIGGTMLDKIDKTGAFYNNVLLVAVRK